MPEAKLISADSHVLEPPDLWLSRVPEKFKGRAPRMISLEQGDAWIIEGAMDPINFGLNQCGGLPAEERSPWIRWEDCRKGGHDPAARLQEIDQDKVDIEILYPTPRVGLSLWWNRIDPEFHIAMIRAYNDWLSEFCSYAPDRLRGLAIMPNVGVDAAIAEMHRALKLPGISGVNIGQYPHGGLEISPDDDRFWAAAQEAESSVNIHVSFATEAPGEHHRLRVSGEFRFLDAPNRVLQFMRSGVFDRFPDLNLVFSEVDCGWVPYMIERLEIMYQRGAPGSRQRSNKLNPKSYFGKNIFWAYITDHFGVEVRHKIGVSQIMWSSDYPHGATDWPNSWDTINADFAGVPEEERDLILAGNAARVYHLPTAG